jgi:His-Xaa-Ser system protein HxsD
VSVDITVDLTLYPVEAVMGTAYVFVDRCYVFLDKPAETKVQVSLTGMAGTTEDDLRRIAGEFQNELLSQALRQEVGRRHERVRELLLARALFGAAPRMEEDASGAGDLAGRDDLDGDLGLGEGLDGGGEGADASADAARGPDGAALPDDNDDYLDDPLGIAVPWEQKFARPGPDPGATSTAAADAAKGESGDKPQ